MGLTIHYQGQFKEGTSLRSMIEEVKDIAEVNDCRYQIFETEFPENSFNKPARPNEIYGISFTPEIDQHKIALATLPIGNDFYIYSVSLSIFC